MYVSGNESNQHWEEAIRIEKDSAKIGGWYFSGSALMSSESVGYHRQSDAPQGMTMDSHRGIFGHGDEDGHRTTTFDGMFAFVEGHLSTEDGTGGQTWNTESIEVDNWNGNDYAGGGGAGNDV